MHSEVRAQLGEFVKPSYAILPEADELYVQYWRDRNILVIPMTMETFVYNIQCKLTELPSEEAMLSAYADRCFGGNKGPARKDARRIQARCELISFRVALAVACRVSGIDFREL